MRRSGRAATSGATSVTIAAAGVHRRRISATPGSAPFLSSAGPVSQSFGSSKYATPLTAAVAKSCALPGSARSPASYVVIASA